MILLSYVLIAIIIVVFLKFRGLLDIVQLRNVCVEINSQREPNCSKVLLGFNFQKLFPHIFSLHLWDREPLCGQVYKKAVALRP